MHDLCVLCLQVKVDVQDMGVDMATFVGHKIGAPKVQPDAVRLTLAACIREARVRPPASLPAGAALQGVGALYVRSGVKLPPLLLGGAQVGTGPSG